MNRLVNLYICIHFKSQSVNSLEIMKQKLLFFLSYLVKLYWINQLREKKLKFQIRIQCNKVNFFL